MTNTTHNALTEDKLKERMNFAKMFERQEKQIKQTPHIQNLLTPTTENQESKSMDARIESLEAKYNSSVITQRIDVLEDNINSNVAQSLERTFENLNLKRKFILKFDLNNKKMVYTLSTALIISGLLFGIALNSGNKTITKEKIVYKSAPTPVAITKYAMTKFVNVRESASKSGTILTTLSPNSIVELLSEKRGWKQIKYKNHLKETTLTGWAYGENLKKIK